MRATDQQPLVLIVEDNEGDVLLIREALTEGRSSKIIEHLHDGQVAIDWLRDRMEASAPLPQLMIIDINLPRVNGHELLQWVGEHEALSSIRILVLSTSASEKDIQKAYTAGAAVFLTKPIDLDDFTALFDAIESFWFGKAALV